MPVPISDAPQWLVNLSVVAAAAATAAGAWFVKSWEGKKADSSADSRVSIVGGSMLDTRVLERLCDQLSHNERATRDAERATIDNTREIHRATEIMALVRHSLDARNEQMAAADEDLARKIMAGARKQPTE